MNIGSLYALSWNVFKIAANGLGIGEGQKLKAQKMSKAQMFIESTNVEVSTSVLPFANTLLPAVFSISSKVCPICKIEKDLSNFGKYFSKERQKYRVQNYCKSCEKSEKKRRSSEYYEANKEARKQYQKEHRANPKNKEKLKAVSQKFKIKYREELQDCYVRDRLTQDNKIPNYVSKELPEIVEAKRLQIKIKRKIKLLNNGKK